MFESNFPVDKVSYSYTVLWNALKRICEGCSPKERSALFHDTAVKAYRLERSNTRDGNDWTNRWIENHFAVGSDPWT